MGDRDGLTEAPLSAACSFIATRVSAACMRLSNRCTAACAISSIHDDVCVECVRVWVYVCVCVLMCVT